MILYLFDIDGTLLDAHGSGRAAFDAVMHAQHGVAEASAGVRYGGKTDPAIVDEIFAARLGRSATAGERATFLAAYLPELRARLQVRVLGGAHESLAYLRGRARLGIATGNIRAGADAKLAAAGLVDHFELGGYGDDSHVRAELVARAIERARNTGAVHEVIVVGDTIHDIAAARACNATVCAVATGSDPASALAHADVVLASLHELPAWHDARYKLRGSTTPT
ncbi:MAG TPA: HAD family hydrolase [Kofleriaceae bacterium]|jgi:phosphoglycolate phosphatase-like HAD superfamily hydrolase|nr:HAD family hydrolase [Kofleriaceae bacterium]